MIFTYKRKAFSLITAIFVMLIMATIGGFIMSLSGKMVQETTAQYRKEQSILYAKSYTELAIMAATAKTCVKKIKGSAGGTATQVKEGQGYFIEVRLLYLGTCSNKINSGIISYSDSINTVVLIDTYVHYRDPEHPHAIDDHAWGTPTANYKPGITYHRRTLQRL
jgi:hypothetical protein